MSRWLVNRSLQPKPPQSSRTIESCAATAPLEALPLWGTVRAGSGARETGSAASPGTRWPRRRWEASVPLRFFTRGSETRVSLRGAPTAGPVERGRGEEEAIGSHRSQSVVVVFQRRTRWSQGRVSGANPVGGKEGTEAGLDQRGSGRIESGDREGRG